MTIVVLGAGATRGAEFAGQNMLCQPPLNSDFFTQIQRIFDDKYKKDIDATIYNTCKIFGTNFNLTMEDLFTQIEFMLRAFEFVKVGQKRLETINDLRKLRESLFQSIFAVLERSVHKILQKDKMECRYHVNLVKALSKDDTIISFNYDCLIDIMLRKYGGEKWGPSWGYCFPGRNYQRLRFEKWENEENVKATKESTIKLLKVHGSINWDITEPKKDSFGNIRRSGKLHLRERLWGQGGRAKFSIIPPEWNKDIAQVKSVYNRIWSEATKRISKEATFIFIGFSFAPTDLHAASLFQVAVKANGIKRLIIVNPDKDARHRTRKILSKGINAMTKIIQFEKFEEFAANVDRVNGCLTSKEEPEALDYGSKDAEVSKGSLPSSAQAEVKSNGDKK